MPLYESHSSYRRRWRRAAILLLSFLIVTTIWACAAISADSQLRYESHKARLAREEAAYLLTTPGPLFANDVKSTAEAYVRPVVEQVMITSDAALNADFCFLGLTYELSSVVLPACERAIELAPNNGVYYDLRGIAYLRIGDLISAKQDFTVYIDWMREQDRYSDYGAEREAWVAQIETNRNPMKCTPFNDDPIRFTNPQYSDRLECIPIPVS